MLLEVFGEGWEYVHVVRSSIWSMVVIVFLVVGSDFCCRRVSCRGLRGCRGRDGC